ncbi:hypothetical protein [Methylobacterium oryzisoli]|uniref:hypothetical protein n=1 Tax=Methylobacterium oryzisoli TaxID=3385502 RepID=UPI00397D2413
MIAEDEADGCALERVDLAIADALSTIDEVRAALDAAAAQIARGLEILTDRAKQSAACGY